MFQPTLAKNKLLLVYNNDEIHSRLLDLVDPARHNHPGIPYDFHSGYIIMISDHMDEPDQQVVTVLLVHSRGVCPSGRVGGVGN